MQSKLGYTFDGLSKKYPQLEEVLMRRTPLSKEENRGELSKNLRKNIGIENSGEKNYITDTMVIFFALLYSRLNFGEEEHFSFYADNFIEFTELNPEFFKKNMIEKYSCSEEFASYLFKIKKGLSKLLPNYENIDRIYSAPVKKGSLDLIHFRSSRNCIRSKLMLFIIERKRMEFIHHCK